MARTAADRYNRVRRQMCGGKKRYDRRHAYMAAQSAGDRSGAAKRVYHCDFCGEYHITHKPKRGDG